MTDQPYTPPAFVQTTTPRPTGIMHMTTAWESVPKFIRFVVWFYAVASMVGMAIWVIAGLAIVGA